MSTARTADLIRAARAVIDANAGSTDPLIRALDAAVGELTNPATSFADLTAYSDSLAEVGVNPMTHVIAAVKHLCRDSGLVEGLRPAKEIVDELNTRTVASYIDSTGETNAHLIAEALGTGASAGWIVAGRERALITWAVG